MDTARHCVDFGLVVLIWLVQLIIYPSFRYTDADQLVAWHAKYTTLITLVVVPLMFGQVGLVGFRLTQYRDIYIIAAAGCVILAWISTFALSVPLHTKIGNGEADAQVIDRLTTTNWPRTVLWSAAFGLGWMSSLVSDKGT